MFKNASIFKVGAFDPGLDRGAAARAANFVPTLPTQAKSAGFVPPRGDGEAFFERELFAVLVEERKVPPAAIDKWVKAAAARIEQETGRKPGKKQRAELKEQALFELMPRAFPRQTRVLVWWDRLDALLVLDTASQSRADAVVSLCAQHLGMEVRPVNTATSPAAWMRSELMSGPEGAGAFDHGRDAVLHDPNTKASIRLSNESLANESVRRYVQFGHVVKQMGFEWDGRVSFTLTDGLVLRGVELLDLQQRTGDFDGDFALFSGTMRGVLDDLINVALGGEVHHA